MATDEALATPDWEVHKAYRLPYAGNGIHQLGPIAYSNDASFEIEVAPATGAPGSEDKWNSDSVVTITVSRWEDGAFKVADKAERVRPYRNKWFDIAKVEVQNVEYLPPADYSMITWDWRRRRSTDDGAA